MAGKDMKNMIKAWRNLPAQDKAKIMEEYPGKSEETLACIVESKKIHGRVYHLDAEQLRALILMSYEDSQQSPVESVIVYCESWANTWDKATRGKESV